MPKKREYSRKKTVGTDFRKKRKIIVKIPKSIWQVLSEKDGILKDYKVNSYQELFDYLIVSGIVFLDSKIIEYIDERIEPFKEKYKQAQLARFGKCERPKFEETHNTNFHMYSSDWEAFNNFLIEKNWKQQWIYEILFKGFIDEHPNVTRIVKRGKEADVRKRKKIIARLAEDEWIEALQDNDAQVLLNQLTLKFENRNFDSNLQKEVDEIFYKANKEKIEEEELENSLNEKLKQIRTARRKEVDKVIEPVKLDEELF